MPVHKIFALDLLETTTAKAWILESKKEYQ